MKQIFKKSDQKRFLEYFKAKNQPSQIEIDLIKRAEKYINLIKWIPGLQLIAVGNSVAMNTATKDSDIDLFIVTKENSMWFVRILVTFIFQILGVRKTAKKHSKRFCLSFFCTRSGMDFSSWKLENDIYLYFWIVYLKPILDYNLAYQSFLTINSKWANWNEFNDIIEENRKYIKYSKITSDKNDVKKLSIIVKFLDKILKKIFLPKTLRQYKKLGKPFGVIVNDNLLKFHDKDIREKIIKEIN